MSYAYRNALNIVSAFKLLVIDTEPTKKINTIESWLNEETSFQLF